MYMHSVARRIPPEAVLQGASMGRLTVHVLDIANGRPAAGMAVDLYHISANGRAQLLRSDCLNSCGRTNTPLLEGAHLSSERYRLVFHVADYFRACGADLPSPPFFDEVPVDVGLASEEEQYHVPLLVSPWAYSTYRGS